MRAETSKMPVLLCNSSSPFRKKIHLIQAYLLSKGTYNCGTWPELLAGQYAKFHGAILGMYRNVAGHFYVPGGVSNLFSDDDLIFEYNLINPMILLRMARVALFMRVLRKSPPSLLELASCTSTFSRSWSNAVSADLMWLDSCNAFGCRYHCGMQFSKWVAAFSISPAAYGRKADKFCMSPFANLSTHWVHSKVAVACFPLVCHLCGRLENSLQQLKLHNFKKHGIKDSIRLQFDTTHCVICLKEFHQRENVINHLKKVRFCNQQLRLRRPLLTEEQADNIEIALRDHNRALSRAGKRRHTKDRPCRQGEGPKWPCIVSPVLP